MAASAHASAPGSHSSWHVGSRGTATGWDLDAAAPRPAAGARPPRWCPSGSLSTSPSPAVTFSRASPSSSNAARPRSHSGGGAVHSSTQGAPRRGATRSAPRSRDLFPAALGPPRIVHVAAPQAIASAYLGEVGWPAYPYGDALIPFRPPDDRLAVVYEHQPLQPDAMQAAVDKLKADWTSIRLRPTTSISCHPTLPRLAPSGCFVSRSSGPEA